MPRHTCPHDTATVLGGRSTLALVLSVSHLESLILIDGWLSFMCSCPVGKLGIRTSSIDTLYHTTAFLLPNDVMAGAGLSVRLNGDHIHRDAAVLDIRWGLGDDLDGNFGQLS